MKTYSSLKIGIDIYIYVYKIDIKQIINKNMLYSTGNSTQYSVMSYMGKECKEEWIDGYMIHSISMYLSGKESACQCRRCGFDP